ncbi:MAG TPA: mechanosensitive ion channel family protein [Croceibacterium sp.]|nr:mechanosensitive ion channel family protein [Croceibacterium sp.]
MEWLDNLRAMMPDGVETAVEVIVAGGLAVLAALVVHRFACRLLKRFAAGSASRADDIVIESIISPLRWVLIAIALVLVARELPSIGAIWQRIAGFVVPALVGWMALAIFHALMRTMLLRADITVADNLQARRSQTRLSILSRIGSALIVFLTISMMLLSIPGVRDIGVTLMASAGLAALAVGAAAQPALKSLIAGFQMALTEPIRIDDVVVIDGEWGRIEDIRMTYVVVRIWDQRRLIVPTSRFLEDTFPNWTRETSEILGTVFLHLDPLTEIGRLRAEFERQVKAHPLWDGRAQGVQVTETSSDSIEVRLLMSAADSGKAFDLRCALRESMLAWIRENMPEAVARQRVKSAGQPASLEVQSGALG